jgi:hypothetical protein
VADRQVSSLQLPVDDLRLFSEVFGRIKTDYVEPVEDRKLLKEAINGMLTGLDPHSAFLDQEAYKDLQVGTQGEFGGLGIEVGTEDGFIKVIAPIEDTPADRAGVKAGDLIIKLDEVSVKGRDISNISKPSFGFFLPGLSGGTGVPTFRARRGPAAVGEGTDSWSFSSSRIFFSSASLAASWASMPVCRSCSSFFTSWTAAWTARSTVRLLKRLRKQKATRPVEAQQKIVNHMIGRR